MHVGGTDIAHVVGSDIKWPRQTYKCPARMPNKSETQSLPDTKLMPRKANGT